MSDPSGEILKLPIKKNFREGLTITDYLMSGYGARKGIVDTALKTANSGYLTRRLIDVAQDIIIREKDCLTSHGCFIFTLDNKPELLKSVYEQIFGRLLSKEIYDLETKVLIAERNIQITPKLIRIFKQKKIKKFFIRSPLTCDLYRSICQKCYGWDLATENLVDIGEAIGIIAGQSIGEPGTQLTMRTFHTGGIFTSEARQQIISPVNGIVKFSKILKTTTIRTNRGEDVVLTKNSGSLVIIPENKNNNLVEIEVIRNTILFSKNNQYVKTNTIIGELTKTQKQTRTEIKPVLSNTSGEIFIPRLKNKKKFLNKNKLLWILSGQVYQAPKTSFLNFYSDYKINKNSYIFRTKLINQHRGFVKFLNHKTNLFERILETRTNTDILNQCSIQKLSSPIYKKSYILKFKSLNYLINLKNHNSKLCVNILPNFYFGNLISTKFKTKTGGILYYDQKLKYKVNSTDKVIFYLKPSFIRETIENDQRLIFFIKKLKKSVLHLKSLIWLSEETYKLNCDNSLLLVEHGNFISEQFEIIPGIFSKTSGIVNIIQRNHLVEELIIKTGSVYQGKTFAELANQVFYPGEIILNNIKINTPSFCEHIVGKSSNQLIIRPLNIYEIPRSKVMKIIFEKESDLKSCFKFTNSIHYFYKSTQKIKTATSVNLIGNILTLNSKNSSKNFPEIELEIDKKNHAINFMLTEKVCLNNYIPAHLKYTNIQSCFLIEPNQFVDRYIGLGYLETLVSSSLEIVKLKTKLKKNKQILLISNDNCITIKKEKIYNKSINDLVTTSLTVNQIGKIIIDNGKLCTIQKGRPYFFPSCQNSDSLQTPELRYKIIGKNHLPFSNKLPKQNSIHLTYYDVTKRSINKKLNTNFSKSFYFGSKLEFSKMFIKKLEKIYTSVIPVFINSFTVTKFQNPKNSFSNIVTLNKFPKIKKHFSLFLKNSEIKENLLKPNSFFTSDLVRLKFFESPFKRSLGIHSITEDYFEQEINNVFCKNGQFIDNGQTIGLLNFEKEITGDIVQGLPRIEELLEARKKKHTNKQIPTNQKKGILIQRTSLDASFEFRKLGTTIKENERINPHTLLKVYFTYYGRIKHFFCDKKNTVTTYRLLNNYEASYRSFKKVQSLILNSVQSVYQSQGVSIADKHLEVVIKQMTTKVLITHEGNTPLLPREVIDLYHIQYINKIVKFYQKQPAYFIPLLLGITKAALNNPSFISAASFQETTRVLTKAAIEGRVDWLRGLKENIIIGHLIPAGTGSQDYTNSLMKKITQINKISSVIN
jgi:hypothetical protein